MKKYKITTAKNAVKKGLVKVGEKFTVEFTVDNIKNGHISCWVDNMWYGFEGNIKIRIQIPEPKPIDFGEAGRVLKSDDFIVMTTGYCHGDSKCFSGYLLHDTAESKKGYTSNNWAMQEIWQDITDTYEK